MVYSPISANSVKYLPIFAENKAKNRAYYDPNAINKII